MLRKRGKNVKKLIAALATVLLVVLPLTARADQTVNMSRAACPYLSNTPNGINPCVDTNVTFGYAGNPAIVNIVTRNYGAYGGPIDYQGIQLLNTSGGVIGQNQCNNVNSCGTSSLYPYSDLWNGVTVYHYYYSYCDGDSDDPAGYAGYDGLVIKETLSPGGDSFTFWPYGGYCTTYP